MKIFKQLCLPLTAVLAISLLLLMGCSKEKPAAPTTTAPASTTQAPTVSSAPPEETQPTTAPPVTQPTTPPPEIETDIDPAHRGSVQGQTYINSYIGITCTLSEDWQIQGSQLEEPSAGQTQFYDMQAENTQTNTTMHVTLVNLTQQEQLAYQYTSDEEVVDIALTGSDLHAESYAQAGITVTSMEKAKFIFLGQERWAVFTTGDMMGTNYYIVQLFAYNLGPCGATVTVAGFSRDDLQTTLDLFQRLG